MRKLSLAVRTISITIALNRIDKRLKAMEVKCKYSLGTINLMLLPKYIV